MVKVESRVSVEEGNRRLLVLADFLCTVPSDRFDYRHWIGDDWQGATDLSCGTTACAFGWAPAIPEFRALGLELINATQVKGGRPIPVVTCPGAGKDGDDYFDYEDEDDHWEAHTMRAASVFFGLNRLEVDFLFLPGQSNYVTGEDGPRGDATAEEVADHIRRFVARRKVRV